MLTAMDEADTIIFDLDGTLIDSAPCILDAFNVALHAAGIAPQVILEQSLIGPPLTETLSRISGSNDARLIRTLTESFKRHYDTAGVAATRPYPGIAALLDGLVKADIALHIATNKRLSVTRDILANLGWRDYFKSVYALDMVEPRLPGKSQLLKRQLEQQGMSAAQTLYVGDKAEDGHAADANSLSFCYAAWGYGELRRAQLDSGWHWLDRPADVSTRFSALSNH